MIRWHRKCAGSQTQKIRGTTVGAQPERWYEVRGGFWSIMEPMRQGATERQRVRGRELTSNHQPRLQHRTSQPCLHAQQRRLLNQANSVRALHLKRASMQHGSSATTRLAVEVRRARRSLGLATACNAQSGQFRASVPPSRRVAFHVSLPSRPGRFLIGARGAQRAGREHRLVAA